ncbi:hypothetical protein, partial [Mesorhizobium sp.]|uniref:hypothetical protein n=1 Tax=Mesorhizobium sp. TaxID=1871066 RepID=UPI0025B7EC15
TYGITNSLPCKALTRGEGEALPIDSSTKPRKSPRRTGSSSMRGLLMALLAFDAPSHNVTHWAGRFGASVRSSKTTAKKTTTKTV